MRFKLAPALRRVAGSGKDISRANIEAVQLPMAMYAKSHNRDYSYIAGLKVNALRLRLYI